MKCLGVLRLRGVFFLCHLMMLHCSLWKDSKMCVCVFWFCVCAQLLSRVQLLASPWSVAISQAKILEWLIISFFSGSSQPRDRTWVSCIGRQILYNGATWEAFSGFTYLFFQICLQPNYSLKTGHLANFFFWSGWVKLDTLAFLIYWDSWFPHLLICLTRTHRYTHTHTHTHGANIDHCPPNVCHHS